VFAQFSGQALLANATAFAFSDEKLDEALVPLLALSVVDGFSPVLDSRKHFDNVI
jgi:hypothetical protein